jgi:putative colanic acid biosynthesis acetyltransferase WcaF
MVSIGERSIISRDAKLCTATHDYNIDSFDLKTKPINIMNDAWICMDVFVAPGVTVGSFGVALARSVILSDISNYEVFLGNPAKCVRMRKEINSQI